MEVLKRTFSPEFRNRLDGIVQFDPLTTKTITYVVDKFIIELEAQLQEKNVSLDVKEAAREWLALHGFDPKMGARPMTRTIQDNIKKPLAEELLFGKLAKGGSICIDVKDDKLVFDVKENVKETVES